MGKSAGAHYVLIVRVIYNGNDFPENYPLAETFGQISASNEAKQTLYYMANSPINEKEFARLIQQHSGIINKVCYFYATDQMPFDDLRQEIYVNIWKTLHQFKGDCKLSTWIYRVSVNSALMSIRSTKAKIRTVSLDFGLLDISAEIDEVRKENLRSLYSLINRLDAIEKAVILLWLDEYSYEEIAENLGLKRNTVATKIRRIKGKLSKSM